MMLATLGVEALGSRGGLDWSSGSGFGVGVGVDMDMDVDRHDAARHAPLANHRPLPSELHTT